MAPTNEPKVMTEAEALLLWDATVARGGEDIEDQRYGADMVLLKVIASLGYRELIHRWYDLARWFK